MSGFRFIALGVSAAALMLAASAAFAADDFSIEKLRADQTRKIEALSQKYGEQARALGVDKSSPAYQELLARYAAEKAAIQGDMLGKDTRGADLDRILAENKGDIMNTGSRPRDVGADVDLAARTDEAALKLADEWKKQFGADKVQVFGHKIVNTATDTTLWLPENDQRLELKLTDPDAFYPEGGRKGTGNVDAVRNDVGWALANKQKFEHAHGHADVPDDLKTMGKSLSKMYEGNDPLLRHAKLDNPHVPQSSRRPNIEVVDQANVLRNYGDVYEAGIADLGDSPEVVKQKVDAWKKNAAEAFAVEQERSLQKAKLQERVQQALADSVTDPETRARIQDRLDRSRESNKKMLGQIEKVRAEVGLTRGQSGVVDGIDRWTAEHVNGPAPERNPKPVAALADVERPVQIVSDDARAGNPAPDSGAAKAYGLYDKATLAFNPVGALAELSTKIPGSPQPSAMAPGAGYVMTAINLGVNYQKVWAEAEAGDNANISFDPDDTMAVRRVKAAGAALLETTGAPGFMRDLGDAVAAEFDQGAPNASMLEKMTMTGARVTATSAYNALIKPVEDTILATKEGAAWWRAVEAEQKADEERHAQVARVADARLDAMQRRLNFDLDVIQGYVGGPGDAPIQGSVPDGKPVAFTVRRNENWTDAFEAVWTVKKDGKPVDFAPVKKASASNPLASIYQLMIKNWPAGTYTVRLDIRAKDGGTVNAFREYTFSTGLDSDQVAFGDVRATLDAFDGPPLSGPIKPGRIVAFAGARVGQWTGTHTVEWSVNGQTYKEAKGDDPKAHLIRFETTGLPGASFKLSARILNETGKIMDYKEWTVPFEVKAVTLGELKIRAALNEYDGPPIPARVANGSVLAFTSDVALPPSTDDVPPISEFHWQVFGPDGQPAPGLTKREQYAEAGVTKQARFKFQPENLANGKYTVQLTHVLQGAARKQTQAAASFEIYQGVRISRIVVTDKPGGEEAPVYVDQDPYVYAYYSLAGGVSNVRADMKIVSGGKTVSEVSTDRPVKDDPANQRVGFTVPAGSFRGAGTFTVALTTPDGTRIEKSREIEIKDYTIVLNMPGRIDHNRAAAFKVMVPERFETPIQVDYQPSGLSVTRTGALTGTVIGFNNDTYLKSAGLRAIATDAKGRRASTYFGIDIAPAPKPVAVYTPPTPRPSYTPPVASNPAPAATPAPDMSDALKNFNDQMAALRQQQNQRQAEIDAKRQQREREMMQAMQKFGQPGYSPYGAAPAPAASSSSGGQQSGSCVVRISFVDSRNPGRNIFTYVGESRLGCQQGYTKNKIQKSFCGITAYVDNDNSFHANANNAISRLGANTYVVKDQSDRVLARCAI